MQVILIITIFYPSVPDSSTAYISTLTEQKIALLQLQTTFLFVREMHLVQLGKINISPKHILSSQKRLLIIAISVSL